MLEYLERLANDIIYLINKAYSWNHIIAYKKLLILCLNKINEENKTSNILDFFQEFWTTKLDFNFYMKLDAPIDEEVLEVFNDLNTIDISYANLLMVDIHEISFPIIQKFFIQKNDLLIFINMINDEEGLEEYVDYLNNLKISTKYKKQRVQQMINNLNEQLNSQSNEFRVFYEIDKDSNYKSFIINTINILEKKVLNLID